MKMLWRAGRAAVMVVGVFMAGAVYASQDLDTLLDKVAETYGGKALLAEAVTVKQVGKTFSAMRGGEGPIMRAYRYPEQLRVEIQYPGRKPESRVLAGKQGWRQGKAVEGPPYLSMILQAARIGLPYSLLNHRDEVRDLGMVDAGDGLSLHALELPLSNGMQLLVEVDPDSGRILKSRGRMSMNGATMEFATDYEDFRMEKGRLVAFREQHYAMGRHIGFTQLEHVEFGATIADDVFLP